MENPINRQKYEAAIQKALTDPAIRERVEAIVEQEQRLTAEKIAARTPTASETARTYHALVAAGLIAEE